MIQHLPRHPAQALRPPSGPFPPPRGRSVAGIGGGEPPSRCRLWVMAQNPRHAWTPREGTDAAPRPSDSCPIVCHYGAKCTSIYEPALVELVFLAVNDDSRHPLARTRRVSFLAVRPRSSDRQEAQSERCGSIRQQTAAPSNRFSLCLPCHFRSGSLCFDTSVEHNHASLFR